MIRGTHSRRKAFDAGAAAGRAPSAQVASWPSSQRSGVMNE